MGDTQINRSDSTSSTRESQKQALHDISTIPAGASGEQQAVHFLNLPPEIRNLIYKYALVDRRHSIRFRKDYLRSSDCPIIRVTFDQPTRATRDDLPEKTLTHDDLLEATLQSVKASARSYKKPSKLDSIVSRPDVALLQACKQINNEAASIFYGDNVFTLEGKPTFMLFLSHSSARASLFRRLGFGTRLGFVFVKEWHTYLRPLFKALRQLVNTEVLFTHAGFWGRFSAGGKTAANRLAIAAQGWAHDLTVSMVTH